MTLIVPTYGEFVGFDRKFHKMRLNAGKKVRGGRSVLDDVTVIENEKIKTPCLLSYDQKVLAEGHDIFPHLKKVLSDQPATAS